MEVRKFYNNGIVVDSNLLLLFCIGNFDREYISSFKRTQKYAVEDFDTLIAFLAPFKKMVTTPNVLTEVSNLANALSGKHRMSFAESFSDLIKKADEEYLISEQVQKSTEFHDFGLCDAVLLEQSKEKYLLLTDDLLLYHYAIGTGRNAENFNHLRNY